MAKITTIGDYLSVQLGLVTAAQTITPTTGPSIDRMGYDHLLAAVVTTSLAGTAATQDIKVQHSTTSNTTGFADYTPDYLYPSNNASYTTAAFAQVAAASSGVPLKLDVDLQKANRYIRFLNTAAGTTAGGVAVVAFLGQREGTIPGGSAGT